MADTSIEWTDRVWNPTVGCQKVSAGCARCYAKTIHDNRHKAHLSGKAMPAQYTHPFEVLQLMPDRLRDPLTWRKPCRVFVNSVSDLFHEDVPDEFLLLVFDTMRQCTWAGGQNAGRIGGSGHTFQVLTKRPERMRNFMQRLRWTGESLVLDKAIPGQLNSMMQQIWLGTSVENQAAADERIPHLLATPAAVRFLSCEPLLGPIRLNKHERGWLGSYECGLHWVIVGGESGPGARPMNIEWARAIVAQCRDAEVPVFVKQLGANPYLQTPDMHGPQYLYGLQDRKGGDPTEWPNDLQVREFPGVAK